VAVSLKKPGKIKNEQSIPKIENIMIYKKPTENQLLALFGIFQSCCLVEKLSKHGLISENSFKASMESLLHKNPENTLAVFGSLNNLSLGVQSVKTLLTSDFDAESSEILRYVIGVMYLAKKLRNNKTASLMVKEGLEQSTGQVDYFSSTHANVVASIAQIYQDSFGVFFYRITVNGHIDYLKQDHIVRRIRCLLFSAIRSAMLFHQIGGRKRHLIFNKKYVLKKIKALNVATQ